MSDLKAEYIKEHFLHEGDEVIIFDVDGTLAHMDDLRGPFEWHKVATDRVDETVKRMFQMHRKHGDKIIVLSGRDGECYVETEKWLLENGLRPDALFMRGKKDNRKDSIIKREIYDNEIKDKYKVVVIYDDRNQVVEMWRSLGLKVFQVAEGNF